MITTVFKLKDYKETFQFEREHPKPLRWDDKYKLFMLTQEPNCQGIWLKDSKAGLIGEALLTWSSSNVVHIDGFTIHPAHRGKGLGYRLVQDVIVWAEEMGYEFIVGEARKGASWHIFENLGATPILLYKDWGGTSEEYMSFKIDL